MKSYEFIQKWLTDIEVAVYDGDNQTEKILVIRQKNTDKNTSRIVIEKRTFLRIKEVLQW